MKLIKALFYFLVFSNSFIIGMIVSSVLGIADSQGLAGGAVILFYGIITAIGSLFISFFLTKHLESQKLKTTNKIMIFILGIFLMFFIYRLLNLQNEGAQSSLPKETTKVIL